MGLIKIQVLPEVEQNNINTKRSQYSYSLWGRLQQLALTIASPTKAFEKMKDDKVSIGINFLLIALIQFIISYFTSINLVQTNQFAEILPSEMQNGKTFIIFSIFMSIIAIIQMVFMVLVVSSVYFLTFKAFKYEITFRQMFQILYLTQIIKLLGIAFNSILSLGSEIPLTSLAFPFFKNVLVGELPQGNIFLINALAHFEFFSLWGLIVSAIGISIIAKKDFKVTVGILGIVFILGMVVSSLSVALIS